MNRGKRALKIDYSKFFFRITILIAIVVLIIFGIIKIFYKKEAGQNNLSNTNIKKEIILEGDEIIYLYKNEEYKEPGYKALTSENKDITKDITIEENIDIHKPGEYEIKYSLNNEITKIRKVVVKQASLLKKGQKSKNSLPILMYHYFYDETKGEKGKDSNWMEISKFEEQLKYLTDNNYYFPTWQEVADFIDGKIDLPKKSVVITMDDGKKCIYDLAIPMLDKYNVPATAFIITKNFNKNKVEEYKKSTINFQSHSDNMHRGGALTGHGGIFQIMSVEDGLADLNKSIEKLSGNKEALAYPFGDYNDTTKKITKKAGFLIAVTTENKKAKPGMDKYALPRVRMFKEMSLTGFKNSL